VRNVQTTRPHALKRGVRSTTETINKQRQTIKVTISHEYKSSSACKEMDPEISEHSDEDENDNDDILFSCRCESARIVAMLLACLQHVSPSSSSVHVQSAGMTQHADRTRRGQDKSQYATVIVSENAISFYVYGFGKQSQAMVDLHAGLFSEFYVSETRVPADGLLEMPGNRSPITPGDMHVIYGGEFGINLSTVLDCLNILGTTAMERTKLCFTYDRRLAIFKIELLEEGLNGSGATMGGSILSTCAIPGMCAPEEGDETLSQGRTALTAAYRSSPIVARAVLKSDFLRVAMSELHDVPGAVSATFALSPTGLEISTVGHSTECHISLPYQGNHPKFFINLDCQLQKHHAQSYPLHSVQTAMKGLDIGRETCISMNAIGMIAIQHQILDPMSNKDPCYVDFIMSCLEEDLDVVEKDDDHSEMDDNRFYYSQTERSIDRPSQYENHDNKMSSIPDESDSSLDEKEEFDDAISSERSKNLFGSVAELGKGSTGKGQRRTNRRVHNPSHSRDESDADEHKGRRNNSGTLDDEHMAHEDSQGDIDVSFVDVVSRRSRRSGNVSTSPQLMYGDTRLEDSDNENEL